VRYVAAGLVVAILTGCHRSTATEQTAYMRTMAAPSLEPAETPSLEPTYVALDAGKAGQPKLDASEIAQIQTVLREVKPCQRALVRYIHVGDSVAMFFRVESNGHATTMPHVFGTHNEVYWQAEGRVTPTMSDTTDEEAIAIQKCSGA
jgi:hypothetical protein